MCFERYVLSAVFNMLRGDKMEAALKLDKGYTYADYCSWEDGERWELIGGEAYAMAPSPSEGHQGISGRIFGQLYMYLRGKPCKVYAAPFDVRLNADGADDTVVQPDILVVCDKSKLEGGKGVTGAPDFIIEILSPSSLRHDLITKFKLYQRSGVREYWIVDPESKIIKTHVFHESGVSAAQRNSVRHNCVGFFRMSRRKAAVIHPYFKGFQRGQSEKDNARMVGEIALRSTKFVSSFYDENDTAAPVEVLEGCSIDLTEVFGGV